MNKSRGFIIWDGENPEDNPTTNSIDSLKLEKDEIYCINEDNIDDKSFSNEYIYNEDTDAYTLNKAITNQMKFTLTFAIGRTGLEARDAIENLKTFFDRVGHEYTIIRNINKVENKFVVDSIEASHSGSGDGYIGFVVSCSYIGEYRSYDVEWESIYLGTKKKNTFKFDTYFTETNGTPDVEFSKIEQSGEFATNIQFDLQNITGYRAQVLVSTPFNDFRIFNNNHNDELKIPGGSNPITFLEGDVIDIDSYADIPTFILTRDGEIIDLLEYIDYSTSTIPILYPGLNEIQFSLTNPETGGVQSAEIIIWYLRKV